MRIKFQPICMPMWSIGIAWARFGMGNAKVISFDFLWWNMSIEYDLHLELTRENYLKAYSRPL